MMNQDELFKLIGIIVFGCFIIYVILKMFKLQTNIIEGLTNKGEAGSAETYSKGIKSQVVKIQDELLINKYRKDYEAAIINLDDYVGLLMIKQALNINHNEDMKITIDSINNLYLPILIVSSLENTYLFKLSKE